MIGFEFGIQTNICILYSQNICSVDVFMILKPFCVILNDTEWTHKDLQMLMTIKQPLAVIETLYLIHFFTALSSKNC